MEPQAIAASFVATHHPGLLWQAKAAFGPAYLLQDRSAIACGDLPLPGPLGCPRRAAQLPFVLSQLEREKKGGGEDGLLINVDRSCCHRCAPSVERLLKELNTSGPLFSSSPT